MESETLPKRERNKYEKDAKADAHRVWRRVRTAALDEGLRLAGLWYRDLACIVDGASLSLFPDDHLQLEALAYRLARTLS